MNNPIYQSAADAFKRPWVVVPLVLNPAQNAKHIIKEAALMMLADLVVMRRGELVAALESHMTTTERGRHFFEVREAINELIADGLIKGQVITAGCREVKILVSTGAYKLL
jgi:hypothetical protein